MRVRGGQLGVLLAAITALSGAARPAAAVDDLRLIVSPGSTLVRPGDSVTVTLQAANLSQAINGVQALLHYDPAVLSLTGVVPTDLGFLPPAQGWAEVEQSDVAGDVVYTVAALGGSVGITHTVATLTFTAVGEGTTNITFRADAGVFATKFTRAVDNSTVFPVKQNSGFIVSRCDDGLFCNGVETFDGLQCQPGANPCDDGIACTTDSCDEAMDRCAFLPVNSVCNDGLFCNGVEFCDSLLGCLSGPNPCDDGIACTIDSCNETLDACGHAPNAAVCQDGVFCNGAEVCDVALGCRPGTDPCDDGIACTVGVCDEGTDSCLQLPNHAACVDALFCNGVETCSLTLGCQPGASPCDDGVACSIDSCDEPTDSCSHAPNDAACADGLFCNGVETCDVVLGCQPGTFPCADSLACTIDTCDEPTDSCIHTPDHVVCDNGIFCDGAETCDALLGCLPGPGDPCAPLFCDEASNACSGAPRVAQLERFYSGKFGNQADPTRWCLAAGSVPNGANIANYSRGISGIRVTFDKVVTFATTPANAFSFEWTTGSGTTFSPVTNPALNIAVSASVQGSATVATITLANDYVKRRWLKVTIDAAQVTSLGVPLDGEMNGNPVVMPSGNGVPNGAAVFFLGNMDADVDADRRVLLTDVGSVRARVNPFVPVPVTNVYDVDKDGRVQLSDVGAARAAVNPFFTLPMIAP